MKTGAKTTEFVVVLTMILFGGGLVWQGHVEAGISLATTFAGAYVGVRSGMKIGNGREAESVKTKMEGAGSKEG